MLGKTYDIAAVVENAACCYDSEYSDKYIGVGYYKGELVIFTVCQHEYDIIHSENN